MSLATARSRLTTERRRALRDRLPLLRAGAAYVALAVLCTLAAYWSMFSAFAPYDDEGNFEYALKLFIDGHPLYNSDFSAFGPFYHEVFAGLFAILGTPVSTDAGALIQLVIWIGATLGLALTAHRLSGRLSIGVAALAVAYTLMSSLRNEPMHPEGLITAVLTVMACLVAFGLTHHPRAALTTLGALASALVLTKLNAGGYAAIAIAFAVIMAGPSFYRYAWLRWTATAGFVLVGPAVMIGDLTNRWARSYAALAVLSALALALVATPIVQDRPPSDESTSWARWLITGAIAIAIPVLVIVFALGSSPGALINATVIVPARSQAVALTIPLVLSGAAVWWSLVLAGVAGILRWTGPINPSAAFAVPGVWSGILRTLAGVAILLSLVNLFPFHLYPSACFEIAMPLAWVAALPSRRDTFGPRERLVRLLIPSLAVLQALLAYPVAGSQVYLGSILFVLCGAICLADGWSELTAWASAREHSASVASAALTGLAVAFALWCTFQLIVQPLSAVRSGYRTGAPLQIPGATLLHLPRYQVLSIESTVATVQERCETLMSLPGLYSFNLWSRLPTPSPTTGEQPWWWLLSSDQERSVLAAAKASPELCVIRDDSLAGYQGQPPPRVPLVAYIDDDFKPIAKYSPYVVEVRR